MDSTKKNIESLAAEAKDAFLEAQKTGWVDIVDFLKGKASEYRLSEEEADQFYSEAVRLIETELAIQHLNSIPTFTPEQLAEMERKEKEWLERTKDYVYPIPIPQRAAFQRINKKKKRKER